ncbi:hypothetical protein KR074_003161 [Drosophila pseudoananassae]|nr:hypothetical protein KR074_003161 [Drosophila pseudoananassae]
MPLYSDTTNYYYSGGSSQLYSPYYSSGLGLNLPGSSSYTSSYNRSYPASYMVPLSPSSPRSPSYTSGSSSSSSSSLHGLGSRYQPKLTTITESGRHSGHSSLMPLTRIQSPKYTSTSYASTTPTTRYIPPRPIAINTADIDVSSSRYRRGVTPKSNEKDDKDKDKDKEKDKDKDKDKDKKQDAKTETKEEVKTEEPPKENFLEVPEAGPKRRSTIRRNRAVVRLSTIRRRSKDRSEDTTTSKTEPIQQPEHQFRDLPPATEPSLSWRQKLAEELAAFPVTSNKKSPGELLRERFYIRDGTEEPPVANQAQVQELIQPQSAQKSEAPKEEQNQKNDQEKDGSESLDDQEELEEMQQKIRRLSLVQCPTFHDICEDISSDKIDDDLNAGELRRRASIIQEQEQEILNKLQKSNSGSFQMIHLERRSSHDSTTTADESGTERSKRRSKKSKKLRHKITAIVEVENAPAPSAKVEHMPSVLELNEEPTGASQGLVSTSGSSSTPSPSPKPKFTVNVETVEEHHQIHKVFKLPKKKPEPALPEGFMKAAPKANKTSPLKKALPKPVEKKEPPPQQHVSVAQIFTFDEAAIQKQEPEKKEPKVEGVATPKPIRKAIQKSESGEDFWSQIGSRETLYMTNRKKALTERQDRLLEEEQQPQSPTMPKETKTIVEEAKTKVPETKTPTVPKLKSEITIELKSTPTVTTSKTPVTPQTPEISTTKPGTPKSTTTTSNIENKATTTMTKPVTSPTSVSTKPIVTPATSVDSPKTPTTLLGDAKNKTTATDVAKPKTTQAATKKDSPTKTKEETKPKIAISKDNLIKIETKEAEKSKAAIPTTVQAKSVTPTLTPTTPDGKSTTKQSPKAKATTTIEVQTKPATPTSTPATPTQVKMPTKTEEIPLTKTTIAAAKTTTTAVTVKQSGSTATSTAATPAAVATPTGKSKLNETTGPKINSGQMAKSPEQQQAIETKINKTTHKEQQQQQQQQQQQKQQLPAQQQQQQKEQQSQTETKTKLTETAKSKVQSPKAGKINVAKKKATTPAAATAATSNTATASAATVDATATTTESNVTPINADQFITLAPTKAAKISPTLQQQHASSQSKQSATTPTIEKQQQQQQSLHVAVGVATSGVATAIADSVAGVAVADGVADVNVDNNSCGNNLSKFATVSNLAQCLRDVDAELEDYIPSSADNSDSETDSDSDTDDFDGDSSAEYSSASGTPRRVLSESMKKKQRKEKRKQKKAAAAAANPPRFDPHKKIKIDTTNKCYVKEEAPRYPLVATPRPLWKREKIVYSDENTDDESGSEAGSESLEEEATSDEESGEECSSSGSSQSSAGSAGAGGLRGGGGATKGGGSSSGVTESSTSSGAGAGPAGGATLGVAVTQAGTSPSIIRMSTCSNDSGFEGGTAPSSPKKMLETSYTYSQFQKSGRFTAPATVIPRFKNYSVDDFHFLAVLGKGSFGKVLLAELRDTTYYYAIKCLKKDVVLEDDDVDSTLIERKVLALGTKHPYLCHLFCTFQTESHLFFVMEYLNGGDLMFHIQESGRFSEERARFYGAEIISGLKFLHKKGIIYRDLKLDNVLLDYEGHVRIADFGMCKLQIYLDKTADSFCGTPDYMAPEIIKGEKYNQNVDWWSFGVLLYEMLIGQSPFSGCDEDELFWSICNEIPWFPVYISAEATGILKGLLEKDYTKRIGSQYSPAGDIADHIFFRPIDWGLLEKRQIEPPFKPQVKHPLDTQYFDRVFTRERVRLTPIDKEILASMDQKQFHGFTYTNPHITLD